MEELLKTIADENPEIIALSVVDEEGIIVYSYIKENKDIDSEEITVQLVSPLNRLIEIVQDVSDEKEDLEELIMFTSNYVLFTYKLINETYLVVLAKKDALYGRVRFRVRSKLPEIVEAL